jgi:hypothetical protein
MDDQDIKYSDVCAEIRSKYGADGVVLMVLGGKEGSGFVIQANDDAQAYIPDALEQAAVTLRATRMKRGH